MDIKANRYVTISYNDDEEQKAIKEAQRYLSLGYEWYNGEIVNGKITIAECFETKGGTVKGKFSDNCKWHIQLIKTSIYNEK